MVAIHNIRKNSAFTPVMYILDTVLNGFTGDQYALSSKNILPFEIYLNKIFHYKQRKEEIQPHNLWQNFCYNLFLSLH